MAAAIVGHNLEAFGFADVTPDAPYVFDRVEAPAGTTFAAIARAAGARLEVIASLNSQLLRERTPPDRAPSRCGSRSAPARRSPRRSSARAAPPTASTRWCCASARPSTRSRASRGLAPRELRKLNGVKDSGELRAGVTIVVPKRAAGRQE